MEDDWDVETYRLAFGEMVLFKYFANTSWTVPNWNRNKFEPDEQWELKKKFMETHKNLFPEDRVVCLAQVLVNMEFLGTK